MPVTTVRKLSEVPRNVMNHSGRGDSRPALTKAGIAAYEMPLEELRAKADAELKAAHWKELAPEVAARISAVQKRYPWYRDSQKNAQVITAKLASPEAIGERRRQYRADNDYSLLEIAAAVEEARAEGQLEVNQAVIEKQRLDGYGEQLSGVPQSEDELYSMPQHELRALANRRLDPLGPQY